MFHSSFRRIALVFRHTSGASCQLHVFEFAFYFVMKQTNLGDLCLRPKQTEILLNVWRGKDRYWSLNLAYWILEVWRFTSFWIIFYKIRPRTRAHKARARDTATTMNMTVDLDTDLQTNPTNEDTTGKGVVVVSPLNALIWDQMERLKSLKSLKSGKKVYT